MVAITAACRRFGALLLGFWLGSLRVRWEGAMPERGILVLWHETLPACMGAFAHLGVRVLISRSRDGSLAAGLCARLGYRVHRGSSSRGAVSGLKALARGLEKEGGLAGMALDGPRGPRGMPKAGSLWLSARTGEPIYPIRVKTAWAFRLGTWDKTLIPLPFSRIVVRLGPPMHAASLADLSAAMRDL